MKKALIIAGMLAASQFSNAQQVVEGTNSSWERPNHSIETYEEFVVTGCTERSPVTGYWSPMFKITVVNLSNVISFNLDMQTDVDLMDFVIRADQGVRPTILLTGKTYDQNSTYKMFVAEVDFNGNFIRQSWFTDPNGGGYVPHQIIYEKRRATIVGTKLYDPLYQGVPPESVRKVGFILNMDANLYSNILFYQEMDSPGGSPDDYDMLESVCEIPNCGYFITGSANNPTNAEQNMITMGVDYAGNLRHSTIWDNTTRRYVGASVYHDGNTADPRVYLLANNSDFGTFEMAQFDGCDGYPVTPFYRYNISSFPVSPGNGMDVNGFRLRATGHNEVIVTGYITDNVGIFGALLTPFQMLFSPDLGTYIQGKIYGSTNNSPINEDYFNESGASVFINTPDIVAYSRFTNKTYVVNPNTGTGYDVNTSDPTTVSNCEKAFKVKQDIFDVPAIAHAEHYFSQIDESRDQFPITIRPIHDGIICPYMIIANPSDGTGTATIYPNPASSDLEVSLEEEIKEIVVRDMKGNLVMSIAASPRTGMHTTLDISKLGSGVYMIDITDSEGTVHKQRFVKE